MANQKSFKGLKTLLHYLKLNNKYPTYGIIGIITLMGFMEKCTDKIIQ